ncbi:MULTISPECIES: hypothetical protein [unclassified Bradyrhizobium]|uniref:hypothetical protein n=1 Tax=unclassified Bradyrhizobium TaxID=2631580 RepID=UPI0029170EAC|nr:MULTISPECIES: hypothetical protein [unclassified Bradyrhizobium]
MADETLDIRARLTAEDQASANIKRLLTQIKQLETQLKKSFAAAPIKGSIIDPEIQTKAQKALGVTEKSFNRLTDEQKRWGREQRMVGRMNTTVWTKITNDINNSVSAFQKSTGKKRVEMARQLRDQIGYARAFRYIYMQEHERHQRSVSRHHQALNRLELAKQRRDELAAKRKKQADDRASAEEKKNLDRKIRQNKQFLEKLEREERRSARERARAEKQVLEERARVRRGLRRGFNRFREAPGQLARAGRTIGIGGALSAAGLAMGTRSAVRAGVDVDAAETSARMNMDQSKLNARDLRDNWALPTAVKMGIDPGTLMGGAVEAAKAGVPEALSKVAAEMSFKTAKRFGIDPSEMMTAIGRAVAQEIGSGRMQGNDISGLTRKFNIASTLAAETATDPAETLSFLRSGLGAGASVGMSDVGTMAFGNSAILAGAQARQASRFLSHLGEQFSELEMKRKMINSKGHRTEEDRLFMSIPSRLGFGSLGNMRAMLKNDPDEGLFKIIESFRNIKDLEKRSQALHAFFGSEFGPIIKNMIDAPGNMWENLKIARRAAAESPENNGITRAWADYQKGLENMMDRLGAVWKVLKAEIGDTLKPFIEQISVWAGDMYESLKTGGLKERLRAFINGLIEGFTGKNGATLRDLLDQVFGKPGSQSGWSAENIGKFGKGLAEGITSIVSAISSAGKAIITIFGENSSDPEVIGKFAGRITALVVALTMLAPVMSVFSSLVVGIVAIGAALKGVGKGVISKSVLALLAKLGVGGLTGGMLGGLMMGDGRADNSAEDMDALQKEAGKSRGQPKSDKFKGKGWMPPPAMKSGESTEEYLKRLELLKRSSYSGPTEFSGRRRTSEVDELTDQLKKLGGNVERAAFIGGGISSTGSAIASSFGGGGSGGRIAALGSGSGPTALFNSTPGGALPDFGVSSSGSILHRGGGLIRNGSNGRIISPSNVPSFSGGGGSSANDGVGAGLAGSEFLKARRARFAQELKNDPTLRMHLAAMQMTEGASGGGTVEALMNRMDMTGQSLRHGLGAGQDGLPNTKFQFYGPIKRHELPGAIRKLQNDPKLFAKFDRYTQQALEGSHKIGGFTDQGLPTDPNGTVTRRRKGLPALPTVNYGGNEFTEWLGNQRSRNYRQMIEKGIAGETSKVPAPADATSKVPMPATPGAGAGDVRMGGGGQVAIHINGGSHDPEALALLVQRRIDESMNYRAHDSESEYT